MRLHASILFLMLFIATICTARVEENVIYAKYIPQSNSDRINFNNLQNTDSIIFNGKKAGSENSTVVKASWDEKYLYLLFDVNDSDLEASHFIQDDPELYLDDMVEVLIDAFNDKENCWKPDDIVYHVNLLSVKKDDRGTDSCNSNPGWNGIATLTVKLYGTLNNSSDIDSGYRVLMVIPWTEIGLKPKTGLSIGINFATGDNDGKGEQLYDWVGAKVFRSPQLFGNLILQR